MPKKSDYWKNPEKYRKAARDYAKAHPEWHRQETREYQARKRAQLGKDGRAHELARRRNMSPERYLWHHAKHRAKSKGVPFDLRIEDIVIPAVCPVLGLPFKWGTGQMGWRNMRAPSLDRIKPQLGYVAGNVRIISTRAHHVKGNATLSEMRAVLAYMEREGCNEELQDQLVAMPPTESPQLAFGW